MLHTEVASTLPKLSDIEALAPGDQARAVLALVLRTPQFVEPKPTNPLLCPNCDAPTPSTRSPYCGEACREQSSFVRQMREGLRLGWLADEEKQLALGQVLWHVLDGGRPFRQSIILESSKKRALKRTDGKCEHCGAPAVAFDHSGSGCNRDINLRPVCAACSETIPFGDPTHLAKPGVCARLQDLADRIGAEVAVRCCDDAATWDWRAYLRQRQELGSQR